MGMMMFAPSGLKQGDKVLVCEDADAFRSCGRICDAFDLDALMIDRQGDGGIDLDGLQAALYADRFGDIRAVFVSALSAPAARDVIDLAWHDAVLVIDDAVAGAA